MRIHIRKAQECFQYRHVEAEQWYLPFPTNLATVRRISHLECDSVGHTPFSDLAALRVAHRYVLSFRTRHLFEPTTTHRLWDLIPNHLALLK